MTRFLVSLGLAACLPVWLAACGDTRWQEPEEYVTDKQIRDRERYGTVHGNPEGFVLFDGTGGGALQGGDDGAAPGGGIAVNPFLWRAALETIDFMPLTQTDPFGGVILTDWYAPPDTPDERFKLNVYILGTALRADGVRVSVFRQTRGENGWSDAAVDSGTATSIEDNILTRARELRVASIGGAEG